MENNALGGPQAVLQRVRFEVQRTLQQRGQPQQGQRHATEGQLMHRQSNEVYSPAVTKV